MDPLRFSREDYNVAIICPMGIELAPVEAMLDEIHETLPSTRDQNTYTLGQIGVHFVVISVMPEIGNNRAAAVATQLLNDFPAIRFGLLVGIGGGVPGEDEYDIRLGDVVVSQPSGILGGVVQYDLGKVIVGGGFERTGSLRSPPAQLLGAVQKLKAQQIRKGSNIPRYLTEMLDKFPNMMDENYIYQGVEHDLLFKASYDHKEGKTCRLCEPEEVVDRDIRRNTNPRIHYGIIGSGNVVIKDSTTRESLREYLGICCVEMEAAGLMDEFPCLVIRGICDYADSHKNKRWQPYAAAVAAAYMKELLAVIPTREVAGISKAVDLLQKARSATSRRGKRANSLTDEDVTCLQLLGPSSYKEHKARNPDRVEGTCQWFLEHPKYKEWNENTQGCLLWTSADPGCGKSVLAKSLVDKELQTTETRTTCYFFFKDDNLDQKTSSKALSALLHQLFSRKPYLLRYATLEYVRNGKDLPQLFSTLWDILLTVAKDPRAGEIVCILDALDECEESGRYDLISNLNTFYSGYDSSLDNVRLKFLVTSRPYLDIERRFKKLTSKFPTIRLAGEDEINSISNEIDLVISARVTEMAELLDLDNDTRDELETGLLKVTHRTYLWLKLIFEMIENRLETTKTAIREAISTIPPTVEEAYEEILNKIPTLNQHRARKLLQIVVAASRPMTLREMRIALAIKKDSKAIDDLDLESEAASRTTIRNLCGLFVSVIDSRIYLIHQTAREFLISKSNQIQLAPPNGWKYSLSLKDSHLILAQVCIQYMFFDIFANLDPESIKVEDHHLLEYAAQHWSTHFLEAKIGNNSYLFQLAVELCKGNNRRSQTFRQLNDTLRDDGLLYTGHLHNYSELVIASALGLDTVVDELLVDGSRVDWTGDSSSQSPLSVAVVRGHTAVIEILLDRGATVSWISETNKSLLGKATKLGHESVVRLLLARGIDIETRDNLSRSALLYATLYNQDSIIKLLVQHGADVEATDSYGDTPLKWSMTGYNENALMIMLEGDDANAANSPSRQAVFWWAVRSGASDLTRLMIRNGTNPNFSLYLSSTPLIMAASAGHLTTLQVILDHGAKMDTKEYRGRTALIEAVDHGYEYIAEELLSRGASVDMGDNRGLTPLITAATIGYGTTVDLLIRQHANVNVKDEEGRTALWHAARKGNVHVIKSLLEAGADINSKDVYQQSPLCCAAEKKHESTVEYLLEKGADINLTDESKRSALWLASQSRSLEVMEILLQQGAEVDCKDVSSSTPLIQAVANGYEGVAQLLVDFDANVNCRDDQGRTAFSYAAEKGYSSLVKLLLDNGADLNITDNQGNSPLAQAVKNGEMAVVELCLRQSKQEFALDKESSITLLIWAAKNGRDRTLQLMLKNGIDINNADSRNGRTAICLAAKNGHDTTIKILLENGADVNLKDSIGKTALSHAASGGFVSTVDLLLEHSAEINSADKIGTTALWQAASHGYEPIVSHLLDHGADIESKDFVGRTALWQAANEGHADVVKLLIERGANFDPKDNKGKTALWQAASGGHQEVVGLLLKQGVEVDSRDNQLQRTPLQLAASEGSEAVMKLLLDAGADITAQDAKGQTALSWAAYFGNVKVAEFLLKNGAKRESRDKYGKTPFIWAIDKGHEGVIKLLLRHGADPNTLVDGHPILWSLIESQQVSLIKILLEEKVNTNFEFKGQSPLAFAASLGNTPLVQLLLDHQADPNYIPTDYSRAPLSLAAEEGFEEVVKLLLSHGAEVDNLDLEEGRTPLWWAASRGHPVVVEILVDAGADKDLEDNDGRTPLSIAKRKKHDAVVRALGGQVAQQGGLEALAKLEPLETLEPLKMSELRPALPER